MRCGYPLTIMIDQGTQIINDVIRYLINHFIFKHTSSIIYYPERNGQAKLQTRFLEPY
jgi:hypothetical protein